jgi:hypothetical protein
VLWVEVDCQLGLVRGGEGTVVFVCAEVVKGAAEDVASRHGSDDDAFELRSRERVAVLGTEDRRAICLNSGGSDA